MIDDAGPGVVHREDPARRATRSSARRARTSVGEGRAAEGVGSASSRCTIRRREKWSLINTCFSTQHLNFAHDANKTLWTSAGGPQSGVVGWLNTKMYLETGDEVKSQGWTPIIVDTNGNGKRDDYVGGQPAARSRPRTSG